MNLNGWQIYLIWLAAMSVITFVLYGYDKYHARKGEWRVRESVLHWLALAGGFPGGWAGRSMFRHKTRKVSFLIVLVTSTLLHLGLGYWLFLR